MLKSKFLIQTKKPRIEEELGEGVFFESATWKFELMVIYLLVWGLLVWIPIGSPHWKGLLLRGILIPIPHHQAKPTINHQLITVHFLMVKKKNISMSHHSAWCENPVNHRINQPVQQVQTQISLHCPVWQVWLRYWWCKRKPKVQLATLKKPLHRRTTLNKHLHGPGGRWNMSSDQNHVYLLVIGLFTQFCGDYSKPYKDPYVPIRILWNVNHGFWRLLTWKR